MVVGKKSRSKGPQTGKVKKQGSQVPGRTGTRDNEEKNINQLIKTM